MARAAAEQRRDGVGPIYRRLLATEKAQDRRYGRMGRPRYLLEALERGEAVKVPAWKVPVELRPPGCADTLVVTPDM